MVEIRSLKSDELEKWFDHCSNVFVQTPRQYFVNHWNNDPWKNLNTIFVAVENDNILSTVRIYIREVCIDGRKMKLGGIGEVSTIPEARKMGLSTVLLNKAIEYMEQNNINISLLFGTHPNYSKLGWKFLDVYSKISNIDNYKNLYNIRKVNFNDDAKELNDVYKKYTADFNGVLIRDDDFYWTNWVNSESEHFFAAEDNKGNIIGYMSLSCENKIPVVKDFAMKKEHENIFEELASYSCNKLSTYSEIEYPAVINSSLGVKDYKKNTYYMVRLISPFELNNKMITSTDDLINLLNGEKNTSHDGKFVYFDIDHF